MNDFDPAITDYYERGQERERLFGGFPSGPLELARTQELIARHLDPDGPKLRVADVGGGPGAYAAWLTGFGHEVHLLDPVPLHIDQVRTEHPQVQASVGDARALPWEDAEFDVVLLLGPLYHLQAEDDRLAALDEARRVVKDGGVLFAAAISRFAALLDMLVRLDTLHLPGVLDVVARAVETGEFHGAESDLFTNAYFHHADELSAEIETAGFEQSQVFNIEGPGFLVSDFEDRWDDPSRREAIMVAARLVESERSMAGAASHLLAVAKAGGSSAPHRGATEPGKARSPGQPATPLSLPDAFRGDDLVLRLPTNDDVDRIREVCQDPDIQRFTRVPSPYRRGDAESFVSMAIDSLTTGRGAHLLVEVEGRVVGCVGASIDGVDRLATVGYWMAPEARRRGLTREATRRLCRWLLDDVGLARLELDAAATNTASNAVAASLGFRLEGTRRKSMLLSAVEDLPAERVDANDWGLLPGELR